MLDKFDAAASVLKNKSYNKVKAAFEVGTGIVFTRIKAIRSNDKSEFGCQTVNEYLSDELASDSDDEKRVYRAERRAEKEIKDKRSRQPRLFTRGSCQPAASNVSSKLKDSFQAIMQSVRIQTLPDAWAPVSRQYLVFVLFLFVCFVFLQFTRASLLRIGGVTGSPQSNIFSMA